MEEKISYMIKKSKRAKRIRLAVYCDGRVIITSPFEVQLPVIEKFISEKTRWVLAKILFFKSRGNRVIRKFSKKDYLENKERTLVLFKERINFYSKMYDFSYGKISVKNQKTRWGSCSRNKNISLNYKIVFLSSRLQDYIIVHELCHLKEFNHSRNFWALVQQILPDYLELRKELRRHSI